MENLALTLVQPNLAWQDAAANREILTSMLRAVDTTTDLILLPEMFTSAFSTDSRAIAEPWPGETVDWMQEIAVAADAAVCGSIAVLDQGQRFNRLVFVTPEGNIACYDKRHLFRMLGEDKRYAAGNDRVLIEWRGWRILPLVCYDLRFPVWSRNAPDLAYDLLVYVANWPAARNSHWQTLLQARAIENLAYVAGVNRLGRDGNDIDYAGHSMVIDPTGKTVLDGGDTEGCHNATIDLSALADHRRNFPAHLDADAFDLT